MISYNLFIYLDFNLQITHIESVEPVAPAKLASPSPSAQKMTAICFMILSKRFLLVQYPLARQSCLIIQMLNISLEQWSRRSVEKKRSLLNLHGILIFEFRIEY